MTDLDFDIQPALSLWRGETLTSGHATSMREIVRRVAAARGCSVEEILGLSRERVIAWPRQEAMWHCRRVRRADGSHRYSLPQIGAFFGRDHTTVLHGVRAHTARMCGEAAE